jgi:hypothetical protein
MASITRRDSPELAAFFDAQDIFRLFFLIGGWERLRSFNETASYESNSAVDSPGAAMSAFEECTEMSARGEEAPLNSGVECAGL